MASYSWDRLRRRGTFAVIGKVVGASLLALFLSAPLENGIMRIGENLAEGNGGLVHVWGVGLIILFPAVGFIVLAAAVAAVARFTKPGAASGLYCSGAVIWLLWAIIYITDSSVWAATNYMHYAVDAPPLFLSAIYSVGGLLCMVLLIAPQCSCFRSVVHPRIRMVAGGDIYVRRDPDATSEVVSHLQAYTEFNAGHVIPVLFHPQDGWAAVYLGDGVPGWIAMSSPVFFVHPVTLTKRVVLLETSTRTKAMGVCGERESVDLLLRKPFGKIHAPLVGRSARSLDNWTLARTSSGRIGCFPQSPDQFVETATSESVNRTSSVFQGTWLMFALGGVIALALGVVGGIVVIAFFSAGMSWLRFVELYRRSAVKPGPPPS